MYVSTLEFAGNGPKRGNGPRCVLCVQNARQTPVQNGVLGLEKQLQLFLLFYAPKWPLLSIHTLKSAMPVTKWRFKTRKASAIFSLNKDGGVFNGAMYIPFALSCKNAFSYKNALRITFDLFVVGNLLYEYRNYETAEICVSLYGTAQMIGFSSRIKHRTDHYICICLSCSLRTFFKIHIEEEQIKNIQVQRSVVQCLKPSKRLATM
jgi:hypothetical protein